MAGELDIMQRLRAETRAEHIATEAAFDLTARTKTLADYKQLLLVFYGWYRLIVIEMDAQFKPLLADKLAWLAQDLAILGVDKNTAPVGPVAKLSTLAAQLGCTYVVEGSMLGGQLIARHLHKTLGLHTDNGARFFTGYGLQTRQHWQAFGIQAKALAHTSAQQTAVIAGAKTTFQNFAAWLNQ